jgi:hypothetical protein
MEAVGGDAGAGPAPGQLTRVEDVAELGAAVDLEARVALSRLQVVEGERRAPVGVRGRVITREGVPATRRSRSPWVSTAYATWLVAKVSSRPSAVTRRVLNSAPALLISTSMRGSAAAISAATRFVSATEERSP